MAHSSYTKSHPEYASANRVPLPASRLSKQPAGSIPKIALKKVKPEFDFTLRLESFSDKKLAI
jgi:hypothetical protein